VYLPRDWPDDVRPPGTEDFERSAMNWLLDVVPPEYLRHEVLRRHSAALASMARYHADSCVRGAREGYRRAKSELATCVPPHAVDDLLAAYRAEGVQAGGHRTRGRPGRAGATGRGLRPRAVAVTVRMRA
jgi:hypothetical protein